MSPDEAWKAAMEAKVDALKQTVEQLLAIAQADPVAISFKRYQARADAQTGRT